MPSKDPKISLNDIKKNIELARQFVADLSLDDFLNDRKTFYAVIRALEVISEASRRLPESFQEKHPEIPWADIAGAGNVYRHDYEEVLETMVWQTVQHSLTALEKVVQEELDRY
ncbi:DUF86 domain-containing protein [Pannus brasiliensis CCIBt3594]|uniref:DUF86 domain-containing protein n=1 Tax=Pannus brasiliensis CCIBt3594 TaxID=1427578 RepID=A0AAW9QV95_9CHRO